MEMLHAAAFKDAKQQDENTPPIHYLLFIPSLRRIRKSNQGRSWALGGLRSHKMNCHLLSYWVLTNNQDA